MPCNMHEDGWHKSLFISQTLPATEESKVEHTCVCWVPQPPARAGKMWIDANDWNALALWRWNDQATQMRLVQDDEKLGRVV